jgi:hypothetical protein
VIQQGYCFSPGVLLTINESGSVISLIVCVSVNRIWIPPFLNGDGKGFGKSDCTGMKRKIGIY